MRPTDRLFEIIQILRAAGKPVTGQELAARLEVSVRTIYRDIAALQAMRTPILGEAGLGYVLRKGYDLPPVNFDIEEIEAITVGLAMLARSGDPGLKRAAPRAALKLEQVAGRTGILRSTDWGAPDHPLLPQLRAAIREERKVRITYRAEGGAVTERVILPIAMVYYAEVSLVAAWCSLRQGFRHFRPDRMLDCIFLEEQFGGEGDALRRAWESEGLPPPCPPQD